MDGGAGVSAGWVRCQRAAWKEWCLSVKIRATGQTQFCHWPAARLQLGCRLHLLWEASVGGQSMALLSSLMPCSCSARPGFMFGSWTLALFVLCPLTLHCCCPEPSSALSQVLTVCTARRVPHPSAFRVCSCIGPRDCGFSSSFWVTL